jgi:hypothetical protein
LPTGLKRSLVSGTGVSIPLAVSQSLRRDSPEFVGHSIG